MSQELREPEQRDAENSRRYCLVCDTSVESGVCPECSSDTFLPDDPRVAALLSGLEEQRKTRRQGRVILVAAFLVGIPTFCLVELLGWAFPLLWPLFNDWTAVICGAAAAFGVALLPERWKKWRRRRRLLKSELEDDGGTAK